MKNLFENLGIWGFSGDGAPEKENAEGERSISPLGHSEQMELAQFGRVFHDWRPKGKQKKNKQEENK